MSCKVDFVFHLLEENLGGFPLLKDRRGKVGKKTRENEKKRKKEKRTQHECGVEKNSFPCLTQREIIFSFHPNTVPISEFTNVYVGFNLVHQFIFFRCH